MEIKEQVLSINQVQELQELGFNVNKHSSVEINTTINKKQYVVSSSFVQLYPEFGDDDVIERYSTMSIGDIIELLPIEIDEYVLDMNRKYVSYGNNQNSLYYGYRHRFIDSLFDCLVWCIKEKHIKL